MFTGKHPQLTREYVITPSVECRRRWGRYPTQESDEIKVITETESFVARPVDESIGGLGLETGSSPTLFSGQRVELELHGESMAGYVTNVATSEDEMCRFSIRWESSSDKKNLTREFPFIVVGGICVACQIISAEDDSPKKIRLWNDHEFKVSADRLIYRSKEARRNELIALNEKLRLLASVYGLELRISKEVLLDRILELEFSGAEV